MDSNPTLHDFVLHLITNQDARLAFQLDPQGTLRSAGLGDLTPADVHDVVPLVVDLTPVRTVLPELGTGGLAEDPATAIGQLQQIVHQLPLANGTLNTNASGSAEVNVATLGAITANPAGGIGVAASAAYDVGLTLDAVPAALGGQLGNGGPLDIVTSPVGTVTGGVIGDLGIGGSPGGISADPIGGVAGVLDDLTGGLTGGLTGNLTGGLTGHLTGELSGTIGGLTGTAGALTGGLTGDLTGDLDGTIGATVGGLTGLTADLTGGLTGNLTGGLTGTGEGTPGGLTGTIGGLTDVGGTLGSVTGTVGGLTGTIGGLTDVGGTLGGVTGTFGGVTGTLGGVTSTVGGLTGVGTPSPDPHADAGGNGGVVGNVVGNVVGGLADPHDGGLLGGITDGLL